MVLPAGFRPPGKANGPGETPGPFG